MIKERSLRLSRKGNGFVIAFAISTLFCLKWFKRASWEIFWFWTIENILRKKIRRENEHQDRKMPFPPNKTKQKPSKQKSLGPDAPFVSSLKHTFKGSYYQSYIDSVSEKENRNTDQLARVGLIILIQKTWERHYKNESTGHYLSWTQMEKYIPAEH